ncbi:hypothetical protein ABT187_50125 [Streptomyces sp. NPDC001817]|uniref:hypothetical protein n=1 Tax=Streptomyces sp. NPDC001817 TaxID=3154398 RepID=UPI0033318DCB
MIAITMRRLQQIFARLGGMFRAVRAVHERQVVLWERQLALPADPSPSYRIR